MQKYFKFRTLLKKNLKKIHKYIKVWYNLTNEYKIKEVNMEKLLTFDDLGLTENVKTIGKKGFENQVQYKH